MSWDMLLTGAFLPFYILILGCLFAILTAVGRYFWGLYLVIAIVVIAETLFGDASWVIYALLALAFFSFYPLIKSKE